MGDPTNPYVPIRNKFADAWNAGWGSVQNAGRAANAFIDRAGGALSSGAGVLGDAVQRAWNPINDARLSMGRGANDAITRAERELGLMRDAIAPQPGGPAVPGLSSTPDMGARVPKVSMDWYSPQIRTGDSRVPVRPTPLSMNDRISNNQTQRNPSAAGESYLPLILKDYSGPSTSPSSPAPAGNPPAEYNGGGSSGGSSRYLGLPEYLRGWAEQFEREHRGQGPIEFYAGKPEEYIDSNEAADALWEADWDRRWGEDFARKHGQPPSEQAWKDSYWDRMRQKQYTNNPQAPW